VSWRQAGSISGTVVAYYYDITSDVTVTVTRAATSFPAQMTLTDDVGVQSGTYAIPAVPEGTYSLVIYFENTSDFGGDLTVYSINGGATVLFDSYVVTGESAPYTNTITFNIVPVTGDQTIDIDVNPPLLSLA
jgi:hypothetical protein